MKITRYKNYTLAVLTRNEHCPPHVHVGSSEWEARFKFSFWHDDVCLWDVVPVKNAPKISLLEGLRMELKQPVKLRKARASWWRACGTVCLDHLMWQSETQEVLTLKDAKPGARKIASARFDASKYSTTLCFEGESGILEIEHGKD